MLASVLVSALAFAGSAVAQNTAAVPACALTCVLSSLPGTGCASYGVSNITCICTDAPFQLAYYTCQQSSCSSSDLQSALAYGAQTCASNGTPINTSAVPSGFSGSAGAASSTSASASGSASSSSGSSAASSASSAISSVSQAASSIASSVSSRASSAASVATSAAAAATSRPASGAVKLVGDHAIAAVGMSLVAVVGGVALLF